MAATFFCANETAAATSERQINLTTYLRDGPSIRYRAVDEVQTGTLVQVIGCAGGWCNVLDGGVSGYVAQATLALPSKESAPLKNPVCIVSAEAAYHGSRDVLYCRPVTSANGKPAASSR